jgi:hypothetical protein
MSFVAANIIDAMRYDFTVREARKVVIKTKFAHLDLNTVQDGGSGLTTPFS